ncbi:MAG: hypothetical protein HZA94_02125 [Candidatus Vogelbacteria bacterium]|nr:hypothetical protein [Candidatus Vogelbacteria bacterium]
MKRVLLQAGTPVFANNGIFRLGLNDMSQHWRALKRRLNDLDYDLATADDNSLENCEWIIFQDSASVDGLENTMGGLRTFIKKILKMEPPKTWPVRPLYSEAVKKNILDKLVLTLWENKVASPGNYDKRVWDKFKYILTWDDDLVDNKKFFKIFQPTPIRPTITERLAFEQKKLLVNISSNRYSHTSDELYSARRKTIAYFNSHHPKDFDLFGGRWGVPVTRLQQYLPWTVKQFACFRGITPDKIKTASKYKFALCYENTTNVRGYISEKIFDIIQSECVPIYWGADNVDEYIDPNAFVDKRRFKNDTELAKYLFSVTKEDHNKMILAGRRYLRGEKFKQFTPESFCDRIISLLKIAQTKPEKVWA